MSTISFGGLATGIDTSSLISKLMQVARQPETLLLSQQKVMQNKVTEFSNIENALSNLQTVVQGFNTPATFNSLLATPASTSVLTATASGSATAGIHTIQVISLAANQRQVTNGVASNTSKIFNSGSFTITGGATPVTINIAEGQNSLSGIVSAINASSANVNASIINDGTNYRMVVTGKDTNNYTFNFTGLSTPPAGGTGSLVPTFDATAYVAGAAAQLKVDGVTMTKTSNTVTDAIQGVTLNLLSAATTTLSVTNDTSSVTAKINSFITAYNGAMTLISSESFYNASTKTAGPLSGDPTVQTLKSQLQSLLTTIVPGSSSVRSLADLGVRTNRQNGTLTLDATKLSTALSNNYNDVVNLFAHNGDSIVTLPQGQYGLAQQFKMTVASMVNPYIAGGSNNGSIEIAKLGLNKNISDINDHIGQMEKLYAQMQANLQKQFNALELLTSKLQTQGNTLLSYLGSISSSSSK